MLIVLFFCVRLFCKEVEHRFSCLSVKDEKESMDDENLTRSCGMTEGENRSRSGEQLNSSGKQSSIRLIKLPWIFQIERPQ